jgi:hypothetical protein
MFVLANSLLGARLLGQKKYPQAEPFLLKGIVSSNQEDVQKRPERPASEPLLSTPLGRRIQIEAMGWLVQLYEESDKPDKAAKWRKELEARKDAKKKGGMKP